MSARIRAGFEPGVGLNLEMFMMFKFQKLVKPNNKNNISKNMPAYTHCVFYTIEYIIYYVHVSALDDHSTLSLVRTEERRTKKEARTKKEEERRRRYALRER